MSRRCDIVIPVYNAPKSVKACLDSVLRTIDPARDRVVVVNDASDDFTTELLNHYGNRITHLHNPDNLGFLQTANRGLFYADAPYVCLLNSDTVIASADWLDRMIEAMERDERLGLVSPLANAAVNLSVHLHPGADIHLMAELIAQQTQARYPDAVTVVGFCLLVKRAVIDSIGGFDEVFGRGYCEESDYHYRAIGAGFTCKVADDVFVYHEGEASFAGAREQHYTHNRQRFDQRWARHYERDIDEFNRANELGYLRTDYPGYHLQSRRLHEEYDILFILLSFETYGGVITIVDLVNQMVLAGLKANIVYVNDRRPHLAGARYFEPIYIAEDQLAELAPKAGVYVATHFLTTILVYELVRQHEARAFYFIQDDEREFGEGFVDHINFGYRLIPNHVYVADWLHQSLSGQAGFARTIANGIHTNVFYPATSAERQGEQDGKGEENAKSAKNGKTKRICIAMMTRYDEKRGYRDGMAAIRQLLSDKQETRHLHFDFFGDRDVEAQPLAGVSYQYHGLLDRESVSQLLRRTDIFIDPSKFQGFGLTALEAMGCGCAVIMPRQGGGQDFGVDGDNLLFFNGGDSEELSQQLRRLVDSSTLRAALQQKARQTAERFSIYDSVQQFIDIIQQRQQWLTDVPELSDKEFYEAKLVSMKMTIASLRKEMVQCKEILNEKQVMIDFLKSR